ncbi:MAG: hypothetical protein PHC38_12955 [Weeksellaceae bacterium]|nr:hypothetical protein [Weeksellaceae bacterium]
MQPNRQHVELIASLRSELDKMLKGFTFSPKDPEKLDFITTFYLKNVDKIGDKSIADIEILFQEEFRKNISKLMPKKVMSTSSVDERRNDFDTELEADEGSTIDEGDDSIEVLRMTNDKTTEKDFQDVSDDNQEFKELNYLASQENAHKISFVKSLVNKSSLDQSGKEEILNNKSDIIALIRAVLNKNDLDVEIREEILNFINKDKLNFLFKLTDVSDLNFLEKESIKSFYDKGYESFILMNFTPVGRSRLFREAFRNFGKNFLRQES